MGKILVNESSLSGIAVAIRSKNGESTTYKPGEMAQAILDIPTGGSAVIESKSITENGTYAAPTGVDGYNPVTVNVPNSYAPPDEGKVVSNGALVAQTARSAAITQNGTYDTTINNEVTVNVSGGGGATILSGTSAPTAEQGSDGDIYLQVGNIKLLDYIESSGAQYINTGLTYSDSAVYKITCQVLQTKSNGFITGWGFSKNEHTLININGTTYLQWGNNTSIPEDLQKHTYEITETSFVIDNVVKGAHNTTSISSNAPLGLFGVSYGGGTLSSSGIKMRLYEFEATSNGVHKHFVPAKKNEIAGLYDIIGGDFYSSLGSTEFIPGNETGAGEDSNVIVKAYAKVSGAWRDLIGSDISDVGGVS